MNDYVLSAESTMDISKDFADSLDISVIYANYELDGEVFLDDFGESLDMKSFYEAMEDGAHPTTSRINTHEYINYFREILNEGNDIIHVCLSTGMSGQYSSLLAAIDELKEEFPERIIYPVDSRMASSGQGLLVSKMSKLKKEGMDIKELYDWAIENRNHVINYTSNKNLEYVARGGRISKTAASIGGLLHICPLIEVNDDGEMIVTAKIRTEQKLIKYLVDHLKENAINGTDYDDELYLATCNNYELTYKLRDAINEEFHYVADKIKIFNAGPTVGSHIGPGTVGIFYWGNERMLTKK